MGVQTANRIESTLREIDLRRFTQLIPRLFPEAVAVGLCTGWGKPVWAVSRDPANPHNAAIVYLNKNFSGWAGGQAKLRERRLNAGSCIYHQSFSDPAGRPIGAVMAVVNRPRNTPLPAGNTVAASLKWLCDEIGREFLMRDELNSMAGELGKRYEELNLVYHTDDSARQFDAGQDALRSLVRNTAEHMDASLCAMVIAEKDNIIVYKNPRRPLAGDDGLIENELAEIYDHVAFHKTPLVIGADSPGSDLALIRNAGLDLVACPILDHLGDSVGLMLIANPRSKRGFMHSDCRLLEVMAQKSARIIQSNYDALTGLMARSGFEYYLEQALQQSQETDASHCVLNLNIDQLHVVNDTSGHHAGDAMLKRVADVIRDRVRPNDIVARIGGDELAVLLSNCELEDGEEIADSIRAGVGRIDFHWETRRHQASISIGIAPMESNSDSILAVYSASEMACAAAKDLGRNRVQVYQNDNTMLMRRKAQIHWIGRLHSALREDRFVLYGQSIKPLQPDHHGGHTEILVRLRDDDDTILTPDVFLGSAERYNLMPSIDRWVLTHVLQALVDHGAGAFEGQHTWAINLSGQSLSDGEFLEYIIDLVDQSGIPARCLCFEITETAAVSKLREAKRFVQALRERGFRFSLDDFGTGLSSFAYLKELSVDYLKIDGTFVKAMLDDKVSESMVAAIHQIGCVMGLETIAEFVEDTNIEERLRVMGVNYAQGHGVGRPVPLGENLASITASACDGHDRINAGVPARA